MKRITAFILLICLSLTIMGYHFVFRYQIALAKTQMKKELLSKKHDSEMVLFELAPTQVNDMEWENKNEFRYQGKMYDLIQKTIVNGKIILRCVSDEKETALLKYYLKVIRETNDSNRRIADILRLSMTPFIPVHISLFPVPLQNNESCNYSQFITSIPESFHRVSTPPPEAC